MEEKILDTLSTSSPLFAGLDRSEIERVFEGIHFSVKTVRAHSYYLLPGDHLREAAIVLSGEVSAFLVGESGKFVLMDRLKKGVMIAPAFLSSPDKEIPIEVKAVKDTMLLCLSIKEMQTLMGRHASLRDNLISILSNINTFLIGKIQMLALSSVREKIAKFLLEGMVSRHSNQITINFTKQELADRLGIRRYTLVRCLKEFSDLGLIRTKGREVMILEPQSLKNIEAYISKQKEK